MMHAVSGQDQENRRGTRCVCLTYSLQPVFPAHFDTEIGESVVDEEPGEQGPRRVSKKELHASFADRWAIESIEPSRFEVRPDMKDLSFSEAGPKAWFLVVRRSG
jgi:hypothetical protein